MEFDKFTGVKLPAAILAGGIGLAALAGCGAEVNDNQPATVEQHIYEPSYTSLIMVGKVLVPMYHPEQFDLKVRQCDRAGDPDADKQGCVTATVDVSKQTWNQYPDGSTIVFHN